MEIGRLAVAIAERAQSAPLVAAVNEREARKTVLRAELDKLDSRDAVLKWWDDPRVDESGPRRAPKPPARRQPRVRARAAARAPKRKKSAAAIPRTRRIGTRVASRDPAKTASPSAASIPSVVPAVTATGAA